MSARGVGLFSSGAHHFPSASPPWVAGKAIPARLEGDRERGRPPGQEKGGEDDLQGTPSLFVIFQWFGGAAGRALRARGGIKGRIK
jgi:hypothetical protein